MHICTNSKTLHSFSDTNFHPVSFVSGPLSFVVFLISIDLLIKYLSEFTLCPALCWPWSLNAEQDSLPFFKKCLP